LSVPSVILGERNYVLNPAHSDFARIEFAEPEPFRFDLRLISREVPSTDESRREFV
jgi:RES domain-containing protein